MQPETLQLIMDRFDDQKSDMVEIKDHLKTLNGRTGRIETKVAIMWVFWILVGTALTMIIPAIMTPLIRTWTS